MKNYWEKSISFEQYLKDSEQQISILESKSDEESQTYLNYYQLGLTRMKRVVKTYQPQEDLIEKYSQKNFDGKILVISEGWCGDAAMILPVVDGFFKEKNEVRIIYRDQNLELMEKYLTNGAMSIPIILILNNTNEVTAHWGPRPKEGMQMLKKYKENQDTYSADDFHNDLQVYYTKNKGQDIIEEIIDLL